jgi:phosphohistidine phosphatase SixA
VVRKLAKRGFAPALIATSPLVRCRQTAQVVADVLDATLAQGPRPVDRAELAPGSDLEGIVRWSIEQGSTTSGDIAWVGHAPDVGDMAAALIGGDRAAIDFSKGAVAAIAFDGPIAIGRGVLQWLATAKLLNV